MAFEHQYNEMKSIIRLIGQAFRFENMTIDLRSLPFLNMAYSSSGEDLWLRQFMKSRLRSGKPGFYVDLGCNEPITTSNSFLFYCYGWHGVCIDANPRLFADFQALRPRDILVNAAITDSGKSLYFAEHKVGHKVSRVKENPAEFDHSYHTPILVPARTLAETLRKHVPEGTVIDFMSVDLEDSEFPAIRSNDWAAYKPNVILIEAGHGFDPLAPLNFPTIGYLHALGYLYQGSASNNVLMSLPEFK